MVALPQGVVTAADIGRVLDAAFPMGHDNGSDDIHLATTLFTLDDQLKSTVPPIGMRGKRLDATVDWCCLPKGWLDGTRQFVSALGHRVVSLDLKLDDAT
jgi:cell division ATPase FtsA